MWSTERAREGGLEAEAALVKAIASLIEGPTDLMLFKKSSTVLVGTTWIAVLAEATEPLEGCETVEDNFCGLNFRDAKTALRASSSALRCCSISERLRDIPDIPFTLPVPGTKGAAVADREDADSVS